MLNSAALATSQIIFQNDTETPLSHPITPDPALIEFILSQEPDDLEQVIGCLNDLEIPRGQVNRLFSVARVDLNGNHRKGYFVRPALKPYCFAFYGAHLYRYWLVSVHMVDGKPTYQIDFKNGGDGIQVLNSRTHGMHDLIANYALAYQMYHVRLQYDGRQYKSHRCIVDEYDNGMVTKTSKCTLPE
ncbi:hypothetical protein KSF73_06870 [Burkholderiaceae bacterium DAT-1]|nr:hypothetical protein [Burkholderiaceae bacterium DAT-1]